MNSLKILVNSLETIYHPSKSSSPSSSPSNYDLSNSTNHLQVVVDDDYKDLSHATNDNDENESKPSDLTSSSNDTIINVDQQSSASSPSHEDDDNYNDVLEINLSKNQSSSNSPITSTSSTSTQSNLNPTIIPKRKSSFKTFFSILFHIIFFLPNYLVIKPIIFIWYLIIFPFIYTGQILGLLNEDDNDELLFEKEREEKMNQEEQQLKDSQLKKKKKKSIKKLTPTPPPSTPSRIIEEQDELEQFVHDHDDIDQHQHHHRSSTSSTPDNRSFIDDKTEQIKQENIFSNKIKSPTASSKYIIPPPQRLYPFIRNPLKRKRKTLILDLDETLIHSLSRGSPRSFNSTSVSSPKMIEIKLNNIATLYYVHKRPYCDYFLQEISKWFELQIFTASVKEYADPIIDWLESDIIDYQKKKKDDSSIMGIPPTIPADFINQTTTPTNNDNNSPIFTKRYYRTDCTFRPGVGYIKDLSKYIKDEDLKNVIILDNSPISYALHEDNAVMIEGWINDQSDRDLLNLLPMLHSLSLCIDVRFILGLRSGERSFEREIRKG
ncbi:HAD-like domain-containing protein [Scheffersomyces coipomensis]|uniref:HAD-like domain-containing protein n=1 Tax=Scheffersomyces coipomensis TaxID=1788519 RepID=UPI00315CD650